MTEFSEYTSGEIAALIAPIAKVDPEFVNHAGIIITTLNGGLIVVGCSHIKELIQNALESDNNAKVQPSPRHQGKDWMGRILSHLPF